MPLTVFDFNHIDAALVRPVTLRILIVVDGRMRLDKPRFDFGLGYVLETLRAPFAWWVRLQVHVARHDEKRGEGAQLAYPNPFRFTDAGFNIDAYDQIWFFADRPNKADGEEGVNTDNDIRNDPFALSDAELKVLAEWMDRGGGVFATGDHTVLGGAMCHRIPRVRSMRRWTNAQNPPARSSGRRHETLQPATDGQIAEEDTILQPLELVNQGGPFAGAQGPHPLFRTAFGVIDRFPDHMHEGEVVPDGDVELDAPLDIPGYQGAEYPQVSQVIAASAGGALAPFQRPRPRVVAYGRTTNLFPPENIAFAGAPAAGNAVSTGAFGFPKRFGIVGVYDGDAVGIGRVVVDSTWHHWLSVNIHNIAEQANPPAVLAFAPSAAEIEVPSTAYRKMQAYYRNVALWLATPAQRRSMLLASVWGVVTNAPLDTFSPAESEWRTGETLTKIFDRDLMPGFIDELVAAFMPQPFVAAAAATTAASGIGAAEAAARAPLTAAVVNRAIVGALGKALLEPALALREQRDRGLRPRVDFEDLRKRALVGAAAGRQLLSRWLDDAAAAIAANRELLSVQTKATADVDIAAPAAAQRVRVVAKRYSCPIRAIRRSSTAVSPRRSACASATT
nr:hypothetical protein [uncultured bacterium]